MPEHQTINDASKQLEQIAARALTLYSRPSVAMEIVRLTEQPHVDTQALKECIDNDPALTGKILRVVNSSLFGLSSKVGDLSQALALLGIKPLKLLVLGFSLPDELFAEVAGRQLRWYWTNTLTRAVAARLLSEQLWKQPGDEPFIGGLLEDLGILVLLRELGIPYAKFLTGVIDERCHLSSLERSTLGFDHVQLSAALLARWRLPDKLIDAVSAPRQFARLARLPAPDGDLPQILHLAELLAQLVGQRRLRVLPELLEAGDAYRSLTKPRLTELVKQLQPQVDQLAEVLSLELDDDRDYDQILREAHEQMSLLAEQMVTSADAGRQEDDAYARLRQQTDDLSAAMQSFFGDQNDADEGTGGGDLAAADQSAGVGVAERTPAPAPLPPASGNATLMRKLLLAASRCRQHRQELSLLLLEAHVPQGSADPGANKAGRRILQALVRACESFAEQNVAMVPLGPRRVAAIVCDCERRAAIAVTQQTIQDVAPSKSPTMEVPVAVHGITLSAGVATAPVVPKNFDPARLMESAEGCLKAARTCGFSAVKSIEV